MKFNTKRADCDGYLELIWRTDLEGSYQQLAYITDQYGTIRKPWYVGFYGIFEVSGPTVAAVKQELFSIIEEHE